MAANKEIADPGHVRKPTAAQTITTFDDLLHRAAADVAPSGAGDAGRRAGDAQDGAGEAGRGAAGGGAGCVGIETEWFVVDAADPPRPVPPCETAAALEQHGGVRADEEAPPRLTGGSRLTFEPGGQLELSGPPLPLNAAVAAMRADLTLVREALARCGLGLVGMGVDPLRRPVRHTTASRYVAMEEHFLALDCEQGRTMMCSTASVQVNLDAGNDPREVAGRFRLAHALGPVLTAMFAASPLTRGRPGEWLSGRQAVWEGIDASRTGPVLPDAAVREELFAPVPARVRAEDRLAWLWAHYLRDATLMMVTGPDGRYRPVQTPTTFGDWMAGRGPVDRAPTVDDLGWHATTLFPPVRPRGWLELRYLDAQPADLWPVAVAVPSAILDDPAAARVALACCLPVAHRRRAAARLGLRDKALRRAAVECVELAIAALARAGADPALRAAVETFADTYTRRGRSPADDLRARFDARGPAELLREEASQCVLVP